MSVALSVFRVLAASVSLLMILSPIPSIHRILRAKVVGHHSIVPLVSMLANSHMNLLYGYLVHNIFPLFATFVVGDILSIVYIAIYYRYTDDRATANKAIACFVVPLAIVTLYAIFGAEIFGQTRHDVGRIVGYLGIVATLLLYGSPFEKIGLVLKHRSAVFLNIHMVVTGTFANSVWVTYTVLEDEWIVFSSSAFTAVAGFAQIALYIMYYPATHPLVDNIEEQAKKDEEVGVAQTDDFSTNYVLSQTPSSLTSFRLD